MNKLNKSPERGTFQINNIIKRIELGEENNIDHAESMINMYKSWNEKTEELEQTDEWRKDNLEYDLRSTQWVIDKVSADDIYAQHLYAALCNNEFIKNDVWPLLTEQRWSCSWRHAGGIIADILERGDYIDWYCSGIKNDSEMDDDQYQQLSKEQQEDYLKLKAYVSESVVTDEIRQDLFKLGWLLVEDHSTDR